MDGPKLLHIHTIKGKGYRPAEQSATIWHAPGKFNKETGERIVVRSKDQPQLYQDVFGHTLVELAKKDDRIVGITPAMPSGSSMCYMMKEFPTRAFDVGIAEAHAVTYSAGLAKEGLIPFCNIYSSFMQRAYDQVIHDVALQRLHVIMCLDRAGLVGEDGPTHHGAFDLAYMRSIPNLIIASPYNEHYLRHLMYTATYGSNDPFVIRYPRGQGEMTNWEHEMKILKIGKGRKLKDGKDIAIISIGPIGNTVKNSIIELEKKGHSIAHYDIIFLKPIDEELLAEAADNFDNIITVENGVVTGGLGSAVLEFLSDNNYLDKTVTRIGLPDEFIAHGSIKDLNKLCKLDVEGITERVLNVLNHRKE
jgi:1-deoxy-D-xylulose-5-phosphate synthase